MPTNPPTLDARLAAVKACYTPASVEYTTSSGDQGTHTYYPGKWNDTALTALLAADPPGATVTVVCKCGHGGNKAVPHPKECCVESLACRCRKWTPTTARVSYTRALTEEERTR